MSPELAEAVDVALRIDPRQRYPTAAEMSRALQEGARGIAPGAGTAIVPPAGATAQTVVAHDPRTRVTPRQPRQGQPRREPEPEPERTPLNRRRIAAGLIAGLLIAVVIVVVVLSLQSNGTVQLQHPDRFSRDFPTALQQLTNLINNNTA